MTRKSKPAKLTPRCGRDLLDQAQGLVYQAWETPNLKIRVALAKKAFAIPPDCANAYVLLAEAATSPADTLELFRKGLQAGERAIGELTFENDVGSFWGILETRPYMPARAGWAQSLWECGQHNNALAHWRDMLRLNPNDNQGIRYVLAARLLELGRDHELGALLTEHEDDGRTYMLWTRALFAFRTQGDNAKSRRALAEALKNNPHVPPYLLGQKQLPRELLDYTELGDESEAMALAVENIKAWQMTNGALAWLADTISAEKSKRLH